MARVIAVGQPANDAERMAIAHLRDHLPDTCTVIHSLEFRLDREVFELDIVVLTPHCVFLSDVKGTHGRIDVHGAYWYPQGRARFHSPLAKLRHHAKSLKTAICDAYPGTTALRDIHVHAMVILASPDACLVDHGDLDGSDTVPLSDAQAYFARADLVPAQRTSEIGPLLPQIEAAIRGKSSPPSRKPIFGSWKAEERLGETEEFTEYRARHTLGGSTARLRVYSVDPYQEEPARRAELRRIANSFRAFRNMPPHPCIVTVRDLIEDEDGASVALVLDDFPGEPLRVRQRPPRPPLTFDQKVGIIRATLQALDHAHAAGVIHRNFTPDAVLVADDGRTAITGFEWARAGSGGSTTIAGLIADVLDSPYQAPESYRSPDRATAQSDLFSAGLVFYEMLTGELAFANAEAIFDHGAVIPTPPTGLVPELPAGFDDWLQKLCAFEPGDRFADVGAARSALRALLAPTPQPGLVHRSPTPAAGELTNLSRDHVIAGRFVVQKRLGHPGGFGVAYQVFDRYGDVMHVLKLILHGRSSDMERLLVEYRTLVALPPHEYVVRVVWADRLDGTVPYLVFDYIDGMDVGDLITAGALSLDDAVTLTEQTAQGLAHLHNHGVYHLDIKPSNLLWTPNGVRIIDFNLASGVALEGAHGGTPRYVPPDVAMAGDLTTEEKVDRDLYALALTLYECLTGGGYPWDGSVPAPATAPRDPREGSPNVLGGISPALASFVMRALAPSRSDRYNSAEDLLVALREAQQAPRPAVRLRSEVPASLPSLLGSGSPNANPFVATLQTLYSQSPHTNAGTRGLDAVGMATYVETRLDTQLLPQVLEGRFKLVVISGNAGDGKTAFLQQLETAAARRGASVQRGVNGSVFALGGHRFLSNHDGSQDEDAVTNDEVLQRFLGAYEGRDPSAWPTDTTRLIAINEGRLVDFLAAHSVRYPALTEAVRKGLAGGDPGPGLAIINLNLRSVVADAPDMGGTIFDRLLARITDPAFWQPCDGCDLCDRCYVLHNARTFMDPVAGPQVTDRLKRLYEVTHLRGRMHITLRDLRSALAFTIVGTRDCAQVHELYRSGGEGAWRAILSGFYFNAWMGGLDGSRDRLLALLREIDVGEVSNPEVDRELGFLDPQARPMARFGFTGRAAYDDTLLQRTFAALPRDFSASAVPSRMSLYQEYVGMVRRRHYFERRDEAWQSMLPYRELAAFQALARGEADLPVERVRVLEGLNRGEGLTDPERLDGRLAVRVRHVENGTIRSYRLFDNHRFRLVVPGPDGAQGFVEALPQHVVLEYDAPGEYRANPTLRVNLDLYEMLMRLREGYRPSLEETQGFYLNLAVFRNVLASAPYREVLLTQTGRDFHRVRREEDGTLVMDELTGGDA
jgi:serine/threonine protein kinase